MLKIISWISHRLGTSSVESDCLPDHRVLVGSHHKTGTVWLYNIFSEIAKKSNLSLFSGDAADVPADCDIFFQDHSRFGSAVDESEDYRGLHVIRDPRDIIVSGLFYHQKSPESWLHLPKPEFGGLTYQQKLNSIESLDEQILFELEHAAYETTHDMACWDYQDPCFLEVKYEDLIRDEDLKLFHEIFVFLGFRGKAIPMCLDIAYGKSLFSGQVKKSLHVRSGKGSQWKRYLNTAHRRRFHELHGDTLIRLGYETDDGWVEQAMQHGDEES